MDQPLRLLTYDDYTVAIICPMGVELAPVVAMLDERHQRLPTSRDSNSYTLGRISVHNVVIAIMPEIGNNKAATVATQLLNDFRSVRFGLLVGIGGGIPSDDNDIRLGDVVVSKPTNTFGGVVQFDRGKILPNGNFERTGTLGKPPLVLQTNVENLKAEHKLNGSQISEYVNEMVERFPNMREEYVCPGRERDQLFKASYNHQSGDSCQMCDGSKVVKRDLRKHSAPKIHYGTIGSANEVIKDSVTRDKLRTDLGILCVEMEAAGLMDDFRCLVIRGICDYADSHKNKRWQPYAAATAAAYAKELLSIIPAQKVIASAKAVDDIEDETEFIDILEWLSPIHHDKKHNEIKRRRIEEIGAWVLQTEQYKRWHSKPDAPCFLWCHGGPGTGKTVLTSLVIDELLNAVGNDTGVAYTYLEYADRQAQTVENIVASLAKQLLLQKSTDDIRGLYEQCQKGKSRPDLNKLEAMLQTVCSRFKHVFFILDALDECEDRVRAPLLAQLEGLSQSQVKIFLTSRPHLPDIQESLRNYPQITIKAHDSDITILIQKRIENEATLFELVKDNGNLKAAIIEGIKCNAKDMILLPTLQLNAIAQCTTEWQVEEELKHIPSDLNKSYARILESVSKQPDKFRELAYRIFMWILQARRPLLVQELRQVVAVDIGDADLNDKKLSKEAIMTRVCMGLVVVDRDTAVVRLVHFSMQEYLQEHFKRSESGFIFEENMLLKTCLTILLFDEFRKGDCKTDAEFEQRIQDYPIFFYAAANWPYHAGIEKSSTSRKLALQFLRDKHRVSSAAQAIMVDRRNSSEGYSQKFPSRFTGLHMAAYYGLKESTESLLTSSKEINKRDGYGRTPLSWAAENGNQAVLRLLLKKGADRDSKDVKGRTPLSLAAENGNEAVVKLLLKQGANIKSKDSEYNRTALSWAAGSSNEAVVGLLLKEGANINSKDSEHNRTPLSWASGNGNEDVVRRLLKEGANVDSKDKNGRTPLSWAAGNGHEDVVELLLAADGIDPDSKDSIYNRTPLSWAAGNGHKMIVRLLLKEGAKIDPQHSECNRTPLSWAAGNGHKDVVELLLAEDGIDPDSKDSRYSRTPLSWAAGNGHEKVVGLLLARDGVNPNSKDKFGYTPLSQALENHHVAVAKLFLAKDGVEIDSENGCGRTRLSLAAEKGDETIVKLLLDGNAKMNSKDKENNRTPLSWAAGNGHKESVELLLAKDSSDLNSEDSQCNRTPLFWAIMNRREKVVELLLSKDGINPNSTDRYGATPLSWAVECHLEALIETLLAEGKVDMNFKNGYGFTPLSIAAARGYVEVVKLLLTKDGINLNSRDGQYGRTPLSWAVGYGHSDVVELLLAQDGVGLNFKDSAYNRTPLFIAVEMEHVKIVELLLAKDGVNPNTRDRLGFTPLSHAIDHCSGTIVKLLLAKCNVDLNSKNGCGLTPLSLAASNGCEKMVKLLLAKRSVKPDPKDTVCSLTPLSLAAANGHESVVKLLLAKNNVDPDSKDRYGRTPLSLAAANGHMAVVILLLAKNGVDPDCEDRYGHTPLSRAVENSNKEVAELLLSPASLSSTYSNGQATTDTTRACCKCHAIYRMHGYRYSYKDHSTHHVRSYSPFGLFGMPRIPDRRKKLF